MVLFFLSAPAAAQFTDPQDGEFDVSEWLLEKKGFLPVPILITEPAIGYGGGAALLWFRESLGERQAQGRYSPPDIFGGALAATENGTTLAGAFGMVSFAQEQWRWRGFVGRPDVNLDFYREDLKIGYNLNGWATTQQVMRRLGESENFAGARWNYIDFEASFDPSRPDPVLPPLTRAIRSSGLGAFFEHDSRDNFFTPGKGWKGFVEGVFYSPDWGSEDEYQIYRAYALVYLPLSEKFILGLRGDAIRRIVPCRLDSRVERPEERSDFKIPDLLAHVREHRGELVADAMQWRGRHTGDGGGEVRVLFG